MKAGSSVGGYCRRVKLTGERRKDVRKRKEKRKKWRKKKKVKG